MDKNWDELVQDIEVAVKKVADYVDRQVIPKARKEAHSALISASKELEKLAGKLKDEKPE